MADYVTIVFAMDENWISKLRTLISWLKLVKSMTSGPIICNNVETNLISIVSSV